MFEEKRKKLIVSADDFGKSELANKNILALAELGKLDRVSVMSNGFFTDAEIASLQSAGVKLDIHLDLADVPKKEKKLKQGVLKRGILFLLKHLGSREYGRDSVRSKWIHQIENFKKIFGRYPDGLNSHQHVHLFGRYFQVGLDLAKERNIRYIRFADKGLLGNSTNIKRVINFFWKKEKKHAFARNFDRPDYFVSLDWIRSLEKFLENIPEGEIELACHPERKEEFDLIKKYF